MMDRPKDATSAIAYVRRYLELMERRALDQAQTFLASNAVLTFPGGRTITNAAAIATNSGSRYQRVAKKFDGWDVCARTPEGWTVFSHGTLYGEWIDGSPFENVRFIDRFEISSSGIIRQDVWNDSAEIRPGKPVASDQKSGLPKPAGFGDERLDRIFGVVWSLAGETWLLQDRLAHLEGLLAEREAITRQALADRTPTPDERSDQAVRRREYVERLLEPFTKP